MIKGKAGWKTSIKKFEMNKNLNKDPTLSLNNLKKDPTLSQNNLKKDPTLSQNNLKKTLHCPKTI